RRLWPVRRAPEFPFPAEFTYADLSLPKRLGHCADRARPGRGKRPGVAVDRPVAEGETVGSARPGTRHRLDRGHARRGALAGVPGPPVVDPRHTRLRPALPGRVAAHR